MPARTINTPSNATRSVTRRFWSLLLVILVVAVVSTAYAVMLTVTPFLIKQQNDAIVSQATKDAKSFEAILDRHRLFLSYLGNSPEFVSLVMGYVTNTDVADYQFRSTRHPDALAWVSLYDIVGEEITGMNVHASDRSIFSGFELQSLVKSIVEEKPGGTSQVIFRSLGTMSHIVLAVPVLNNGLVEGALLGAFRLDQSAIFPPNEIAKRTHISPVESAITFTYSETNASVVALKNTDLSIILIPNIEATAAAGRSVLRNAVSAMSLVLMAAFALFAALSRKALIEPHEKLEQQKQSLSELAAIAERANDTIIVTDLDAKIVWTNPAFEKLSGFSSFEVIGRTPWSLLHGPETDKDTSAEIQDALSQHRSVTTEILNYAANGRPYWVNLMITPLRNNENELYGFMAVLRDVTEARAQQDALIEAKQEIEHQALHDPLTALPNRRALDIAMEVRQNSAAPDATLLRIDLDHFKYVNDTLGHDAGDFALCEVARIMIEEIRADDLPVRVGGDEFVVFLGPEQTAEDADALAKRLLSRVREPMKMGTKTIRIGASFGIASTCDKLVPLDQLIVGADAALYEAKDAGRNRVRLYTPELHKAVLDRRLLAREIRRAVAKGEFTPYFQPQVCAKTHRITGVETLARWQSSSFGLLMPDDFLPIAKQLSAIEDIDAIIFEKAIEQIDTLRAEGFDIPKVAFNVTVERINNPDVLTVILDRRTDDLRIAFEILESVLVEDQSELFRFSLDRLREMGVSIEVDDFGSGHASVLGLMHLMPDVMKIDKQLVLPIMQSETSLGMVRQIIGMAELMGVRVTAEGVESLEHAKILAELGCDTLQGFAFSKPLPAEGLKEFLECRSKLQNEAAQSS